MEKATTSVSSRERRGTETLKHQFEIWETFAFQFESFLPGGDDRFLSKSPARL